MKNKTVSFVVFCVTFLIAYFLIQIFAMQSFNVMQVKGKFPAGAQIVFSNSTLFHPFAKKTAVGNVAADTASVQKINLQLSNRLVRQIKVDIVHFNQPYTLKEISLHSHFSKNAIAWNGSKIGESFEETTHREGEITSYTLRKTIKGKNIFIEYFVPILIGLLMYLTLGRTNWTAFPPLQDLKNVGEIRDQSNFATLDGLRGLAALLVLMHHATTTFKGYGSLGVWIFFVLSGFLLTKSFVVAPETACRLPALREFMTRRFRRIVPMYYLMITVIYLIQNQFDIAIRHFLFIQGSGHYWTILQEMYFYMLLPLLTLGSFYLFRGRAMPTLIFLFILAFVWDVYGNINVFSIYGLGQPLKGYFQVFMLGMIGAYLFHGVYAKNQNLKEIFERYQWVSTVIALLLLTFILESSRRHNWISNEPLLGGAICLLLILLAVVGSPSCFYKKILNNSLIRYVGIVGYSFYLIHPYSIFMIRAAIEHFFDVPFLNVNEFFQLGAGFVLTLILSSITYTIVERPFLRKAR